jgi:hypothetical protein
LLGFLLNIRLEPNLEHLSGPDDLITAAAAHARDVDAICEAVGTIIALKTIERPSEAMLASVNSTLWTLLREIERRLRPEFAHAEQNQPETWDLLRSSGLLTEPVLVDYALARFAETQLQVAIERSKNAPQLEQLPVRLLRHDDEWVLQATQNFLAAASKHQGASGAILDSLDPQLYHKLCWRVVAAWEILEGHKDPSTADAARSLLANHDEARTLRAAARKLIFFIHADHREALSDPVEAGLHLFIAWLAHALEIDHDHAVRLAASHSIAPLATMLRAVDIDQERAMAILFLLKGFDLKPLEVNMFEEHYATLSAVEALQAVHIWRAERARLLLGLNRDEAVSL